MTSIPNKDESPSARPHRSKKDRPCDYCRGLKHSCRIPTRGQPCERCARAGRECTFLAPSRTALRRSKAPESSANAHTPFTESPFFDGPRIQRKSGQSVAQQLAGLLASDDEGSEGMSTTSNDAYYSSLDMESNDIEESHYLGTAAFQQMISGNQPTPALGTTSDGDLVYHQVAPGVFFLRSPSRVYGLSNGDFASENAWKAVTERLREVDPGLSSKLFQLFLDRTLPALPIINRYRLESACAGAPGAGPFPYAVLVGIVVHALSLNAETRHLGKEMWTIALNLEDNLYRAPRLQTVQLSILELYGWPVSTPGGNHMSITRLLGAAQLLGLHRDPAHWHLPRWERATRKKLWFLLYIADKWNALQYGRPSNIHIQQIPLPTIDDEDAPVGESGSLSFSYVGMCRLTAVLSSLLPLLENSAEISLTTQRAILVTAVESLDEMSALVDPPGPGQLSFRLCHLGITILVCQMTLDLQILDRTGRPAGSQRLCERSLAAVRPLCEFVEGIDMEASGEYWAPWSSLNLTRAVSLLLRLARICHRNNWTQAQAVHQALERLIVALVAAEKGNWHIAGDALRVVRIQLSSASDIPSIETIRAHLAPAASLLDSGSTLPVNSIDIPQLAGTVSNDDVAALFNLMLQGNWMAGVAMSNVQT